MQHGLIVLCKSQRKFPLWSVISSDWRSTLVVFWAAYSEPFKKGCQRTMTPPGKITFLGSISVPWYSQKTITGLCPAARGMKNPFSNPLIRSVISESCLGWGWKHQKIFSLLNHVLPWYISCHCCSALCWSWQLKSQQQLCFATASPVVALVSETVWGVGSLST